MSCSQSDEEEGAEYALKLVQGSRYWRKIYLKNPDGTPMDLTGWLLAFPTGGKSVAQIRRKKNDSAILAEIALSFTDDDPELGAIELLLDADTTAGLTAGEHTSAVASQAWWEFKRINSAGEPLRLLYGPVTIERSVSRPA